jgi:hypothetical protein
VIEAWQAACKALNPCTQYSPCMVSRPSPLPYESSIGALTNPVSCLCPADLPPRGVSRRPLQMSWAFSYLHGAAGAQGRAGIKISLLWSCAVLCSAAQGHRQSLEVLHAAWWCGLICCAVLCLLLNSDDSLPGTPAAHSGVQLESIIDIVIE